MQINWIGVGFGFKLRKHRYDTGYEHGDTANFKNHTTQHGYNKCIELKWKFESQERIYILKMSMSYFEHLNQLWLKV